MVMNQVVEEYKSRYRLNYSVLATPAEGLSGRFTRLDRKALRHHSRGDRPRLLRQLLPHRCEGAGDHRREIRKEAPFHAITRGGHITYVELDGEAKKKRGGYLEIVKVMHDEE